MANTRTTDDYYSYVTVDTTPGASGYYTEEVNPRREAKQGRMQNSLIFSVEGSGTMTVTLQFKTPVSSSWADYATLTDNGISELIGTGAGIRWRAGVKNDAAYTSGSKSFGFSWD